VFSCYKVLCISDLSHACYIPNPFRYGLLGQPVPSNIRWSVLKVVACGCKFLHMPVTSSFLRSVIIDRILLSIVVLRCRSLSIVVLCCRSLFFVVELCSLLWSLFFVVERCSLLSIFVFCCRTLFFVVDLCYLLSIFVICCRSLCFVVDCCVLLSIVVFCCRYLFSVVDRCSLTGTLLKFKIAMNAIDLNLYIIMKYFVFFNSVTRVRTEQSEVRFQEGSEYFPLLKSVHTISGAHPASCSMSTGFLVLWDKMVWHEFVHTHYPVPKLGMSGDIPQLPLCLRDIHRGNFIFLSTNVTVKKIFAWAG